MSCYDAADAALWVGEIPDHVVSGDSTTASAHLRSLFEQFGDIVSVTVRTKQGVTSSVSDLSTVPSFMQHSIQLTIIFHHCCRIKELGHCELLNGSISHEGPEGRCCRPAAESRDAGSQVRLSYIVSIVNHSVIAVGARGRLNVKRAAVQEELQKGSTGALGSIVKQHASAVLVTECEHMSPVHTAFHNLQQYNNGRRT